MDMKTKLTKNCTVGRPGKITYIVIHDVGAVSTAANNATYFANNKVQASAHYFVDKDQIWQSVRDEDTAWHCGAVGGLRYVHPYCRNSNSISIEMCLVAGKKITEVTFSKTVELTKELMKKYKIPAANVIRHKDVTDKNCPANLSENRWKEFKKAIGSDTKLTTANKPAETKKPGKPVLQRLLCVGDIGGQVKELQKLLNGHGYMLTIDGNFGKKTLDAVRAFQKKSKLTVDGLVGNKTWSKL